MPTISKNAALGWTIVCGVLTVVFAIMLGSGVSGMGYCTAMASVPMAAFGVIYLLKVDRDEKLLRDNTVSRISGGDSVGM